MLHKALSINNLNIAGQFYIRIRARNHLAKFFVQNSHIIKILYLTLFQKSETADFTEFRLNQA